jgi:hypothetical protein
MSAGHLLTETGGVAHRRLSDSAADRRIRLASNHRRPDRQRGKPTLLLVRVYTVPQADGLYGISIRQAHRIVAEALVAQAKSRLLRGFVYPDTGEIIVEHFDLQVRPLRIRQNLRISVLQMLSFADIA